MKKIIQYILAMMLCFSLYGVENNSLSVQQVISGLQSQQEEFHAVNLFHSPEQRSVEGIGTYIHFLLDEKALQNAFKANYNSIKFELPLPGGTSVILLLTKHEILTDDFILAVTNKKGEYETAYQPGVYYYGIVEGNESSIVAVSVFKNHLSGVISAESGNWNLGPLEENGRAMTTANEYVYFNDKSFHLPLDNICSAPDEEVNAPHDNNGNQRSVVAGNCVRLFIDCDYDFYIYKSSNATAVADYVTALFNVESTIYTNESVNVVLSEINVWTVADPFNLGNSRSNMDSYSDYRTTNFNGDLAQLLAKDAGGLGGIAWINVLCANYSSSSHAGPVSYCDINANYSVGALLFPTYTWDANVITHELGHNLGSRHTHWCGWTGGPIDNCNTCWNPPVPFDGSCTSGPTPAPGTGTVMSYCHGCSGIGISLTAGFGTQPGNVIRNNVTNAGCLAECESGCLPIVSVDVPVITGENLQYAASDIVYGNNIIQSGATASFTGGNAVILNLGFNALSGSVFTASIASCTAPASLPSAPESSPASLLDTSLLTALPEAWTEEQKGIMLSAYPNPFRDAVTISFSLPKSENVRVEIISMEGRLLATLFEGNINENEIYHAEFQSGLLESGMYFYRMITGSGMVQNKKLLLMR